MSEQVNFKYYLDGALVEKSDIDWESNITVKTLKDEVFVTTTQGYLSTRHKMPPQNKKEQMSEFIEVTVVTAKLKDEIKEKFINISLGKEEPNKKDSYGKDAEFYRNLGVEPPEDFDSEEDEDFIETLKLKKEDYNVIEKPARIRPEIITFFVNNEDFGCTIYTQSDFTISVKEEVEEIESKIKTIKNGVK